VDEHLRLWISSVDSIEPDADSGAVEAPNRFRRANEHSRRQSSKAEAASSRMAGAPAQKEIDEPTGKFLRPRSDFAHLELLA
jgi:hypothetical protein